MKPTARCFTHDWTAEWLISEAKAALEANHQEVAARLLHEAVSLEPGNVEAQLLLGWTAATPAAAVEYFQTTLALAPDDSLAEDGLAWATEWLVQEHTQLMTPALGPHWQTPLTPSEVHWTPSPSLTGKGEAERTVPPRLRGSEADKFGVAGSALTPQPPLLPVRRAGEGERRAGNPPSPVAPARMGREAVSVPEGAGGEGLKLSAPECPEGEGLRERAKLPTLGWLYSWIRPEFATAGAYLLAISLAETVTVLVRPEIGLLLHALVLVALVGHSSRPMGEPQKHLCLALSLMPLIRVLSLILPIARLPLIYGYFLVGAPLFLAAFIVARHTGFSRTDIAFTIRRPLRWQVWIGLTGLGFGYLEYRILQPAPLVGAFTVEHILIPALILFFFTGLLEEVVFRGVLQRAALAALGSYGVLFVALLFAVLHLGYRSVPDLVFVFAVGLFYGLVIARTGTMAGATVSHGLSNIGLFLIWPFLLSSGLTQPVQGRETIRVDTMPLTAPVAPASQPTPTQPVPVLVAARPPDFTSSGTYWFSGPGGYNGPALWTYTNGNEVDSQGTWRPAITTCGVYELAAYIPKEYATTRSATYEIDSLSGLSTVIVDQWGQRGQWVHLGQFTFRPGARAEVRLTDATGEAPSLRRQVAFDALRWTWVQPCEESVGDRS